MSAKDNLHSQLQAMLTQESDEVQAVEKVLSPARPSACLTSCGLAIWGIDAPRSCHYSLSIPVLVISLRGISTIFSVQRLDVKPYQISIEIPSVILSLWLKGPRLSKFLAKSVKFMDRLRRLSGQLKSCWPVLLRVRKASKIFPRLVDRVQTKILLSLPNSSPMIFTFHRKGFRQFSVSARQQ
jgi:hypothetical protein